MAQAQFPQVPDLVLSTDKLIGDGTNLNFGKYSVSNPHPGYGKDPNIMNEFGHTVYPKWIKNKNNESVIVNSKEEEAELIGEKSAVKGWK